MNHRRLRHNASTAIPRRLISVDTETRVRETGDQGYGQHVLWFGCVRHCRLDGDGDQMDVIERSGRTFFTSAEFWEFVEQHSSAHETCWICAHNLAFDATILGTWERITSGELRVKTPNSKRTGWTDPEETSGLLMLEDPPTLIGLESRTDNRYVLLDTLNYWRMSLRQLAKSVGLEKIDIDLSTCTVEEVITYCQRDVEIVETAMTNLIRWWSQREYGKFRWTAPGLAWSAFRHSFYTHSIDFHDSQDVRKLERESYYGGQLEAYYLGPINEPVYQYDVNSLYPSVMTDHDYPVRLLDWSQGPIWTGDTIPHDPRYCIAEVQIRPTECTLPLRCNGEVWYARGPMLTTLAGPELDWAYQQGLVESVGSWSFYLCRPIFTQFVTHFFGEKQRAEDQGDLVTRTFTKLMMNSLYGKFGQRGGSWKLNPDRLSTGDCGVFWEKNLATGEQIKCLGLGNVVFDYTPGQEIAQSFPAISSFVTSYSRQRMRALRNTAGRGNYYYQSTDSLIVNLTGHERLVSDGEIAGREMGKLKLEKSADSATIRGLHWYEIGDKHVEGSVKPTAEWIDPITWKEPHFERLAPIIGRGGGAYVTISEIEKTRNLLYRKGHVGLDGWVTPYTGDEVVRIQSHAQTVS